MGRPGSTLLLGVLPYLAALRLVTGPVPAERLDDFRRRRGHAHFGKLLAFRCPKDTIFLDHPYQGGLVAFVREEPSSK